MIEGRPYIPALHWRITRHKVIQVHVAEGANILFNCVSFGYWCCRHMASVNFYRAHRDIHLVNKIVVITVRRFLIFGSKHSFTREQILLFVGFEQLCSLVMHHLVLFFALCPLLVLSELQLGLCMSFI